jgi:TPR repeat protein
LSNSELMKFFRALYRLGVSLRTCSGYKWRSSCSSINNNLRASWRADLSTFTKKNLHDPAEQVEQLLSDLDTLSVEQRKDAYARALNSAQQGSSKGKLLVGCLLRCGIGTERNEKKALEVLEPLAESGDAYASFLCGDILEQMYEETLSATHVAEQSAQISDMKAYLDEKYSESRTFLEKAIRYYEKSVENGNDESLVALGNAWLKMQHPEKAKEAYMKAVEKGITSALLCLGNLYFQGFVGKFSSVSPDGLKASKYLTASAEEGNTEAKYLLGELYSSGLEPIEPDEASAIRYLESAAEDNHSEACYLLSKILLDKEELDPGTVDMEKILKYLLVAAEENHSGACYFLADLYYKAGGLENYQQALSLFERSGVSVWHCLLHI